MQTKIDLAGLLLRTGRGTQSEALFRETSQALEEELTGRAMSTGDRQRLAKAQLGLGRALNLAGRTADATAMWTLAADLLAPSADEAELIEDHRLLALISLELGHGDKARRSAEILHAKGRHDIELLEAASRLGWNLPEHRSSENSSPE